MGRSPGAEVLGEIPIHIPDVGSPPHVLDPGGETTRGQRPQIERQLSLVLTDVKIATEFARKRRSRGRCRWVELPTPPLTRVPYVTHHTLGIGDAFSNVLQGASSHVHRGAAKLLVRGFAARARQGIQRIEQTTGENSSVRQAPDRVNTPSRNARRIPGPLRRPYGSGSDGRVATCATQRLLGGPPRLLRRVGSRRRSLVRLFVQQSGTVLHDLSRCLQSQVLLRPGRPAIGFMRSRLGVSSKTRDLPRPTLHELGDAFRHESTAAKAALPCHVRGARGLPVAIGPARRPGCSQ